MATNKVKNLKKKDWQDIAKSYKIKFEPKNGVRYLVEKIAEKIKVDDKIVKLDDLKQEVHDTLVKKKVVDKETGKLIKKAPAKKKTTSKKSAKKEKTENKSGKKASKIEGLREHCTRLGVSYTEEMDEEELQTRIDAMGSQPLAPKTDEKKAEKKDDVPKKSELELLREKCTSLGLAYGSAHTEQDLRNLVGAVSGGGATGGTPNAKNDAVVEVESSEDDSTEETVEEQADGSSNDGHVDLKTEETVEDSGLIDTAEKQTALAIQKGKEQFGDDFDETNLNGSFDPMALEPFYLFMQGSLKNGKSIIFNFVANEWRGKDKIPVPTPQIKSPVPPAPAQSTIPTVVNPVTKADPTQVGNKELKVYKDVFMGAINGHFRLMSKSEVVDILNRANYPFTYQLNHHKEDSSLIEIILESSGNSLRLPSENDKQWISISG